MARLLNRSQLRAYILKRGKELNGGYFERVASAALDEYERCLARAIDEDLKRHPSIGRTFRQVIGRAI